jgi:hypothetical protein
LCIGGASAAPQQVIAEEDFEALASLVPGAYGVGDPQLVPVEERVGGGWDDFDRIPKNKVVSCGRRVVVECDREIWWCYSVNNALVWFLMRLVLVSYPNIFLYQSYISAFNIEKYTLW